LKKNVPSLRLGALFLAATALSGCLGNSTAAPQVGKAAFDAAIEDVQGRAPTIDMRREGTATYKGAVNLQGQGDAEGSELFGEVNLDVDFGAIDPEEAISGSASNFVGTANGENFDIEGTLTTDNNLPTVLAINEQTIDLPTGGTQDLVTGSVMINMTGDLTANDETTGVLLNLGGVFVGPGGEAIHGGAGMLELNDVTMAPGESVGQGFWFAIQE
jgi:hypothetical protein